MNYNDVTEALRETRGSYKWKVEEGGKIRAEILSGPHTGRSLCPLTAIVFNRTGEYLGVADATAKGRLGLSEAVRALVVNAADHRTPKSEGPQRARKDLLSATGIAADGCEPFCGC